MPVYEYLCPNGHVQSEFRTVADRERPKLCYCHYMAAKAIVTPPKVFSDYEGYESPATGKWIAGRRARAEDLARSHCRPYEEGERQAYERRQAAEERKLDKEVDAIVEQTLATI